MGRKSERIWPSADGGFYVQFEPLIGWWRATTAGRSIPVQATERFQFPDPGPETPENENRNPDTAALVEDRSTRLALVVSQFHSHYAVIDRASHTTKATGTLSQALWPWWFATVDSSAHVAFISSALEGGWLYEFDLTSLRVARKVPGLFFYENGSGSTRPRASSGHAAVVWRCVGVDRGTFEPRYRIPVESTVRDIQLDEGSGDLYTCAFMSGNVYRIERHERAASKIGWCGACAATCSGTLDARFCGSQLWTVCVASMLRTRVRFARPMPGPMKPPGWFRAVRGTIDRWAGCRFCSAEAASRSLTGRRARARRPARAGADAGDATSAPGAEDQVRARILDVRKSVPSGTRSGVRSVGKTTAPKVARGSAWSRSSRCPLSGFVIEFRVQKISAGSM